MAKGLDYFGGDNYRGILELAHQEKKSDGNCLFQAMLLLTMHMVQRRAAEAWYMGAVWWGGHAESSSLYNKVSP